VQTFSETLYLDIKMPEGTQLEVPAAQCELAAYNVRGDFLVNGEPCPVKGLAVGQTSQNLLIEAHAPSRVMVIGGEPLSEPREIWWNFVSSSKDRIERAKADWAAGRFPKIPGDDTEFIPLPGF
jgi:redox-sensitive bicupin YhaK (pirin superfamily)